MKLHNVLSNEECIGKGTCAQPGVDKPWVEYSDGNNGEKDCYRDVWVGEHCAYMIGENCRVKEYDIKTRKVTLYNESAKENCDGWDGVFEIPYEQYVADFGLDWRY